MKQLLLGLLIILSFNCLHAQETYNVDGESLYLKTQIDGEIDLLWNIIDSEYRYFLRTADGTIVELKNTKKGKEFQKEYLEVLRAIDPNRTLEVEDVDLTLYDLGVFIDKYNQSLDANYNSQIEEINILFRFGAFAGVTNSPFVRNPEDAINPQLGFTFEMIDIQTFPRHALFLNGRYVFKGDKFEYNVAELALGYRFRVINKQKFTLYPQITFGSLSFLNTTIFFTDDNGELIPQRVDEVDFNAPFSLGIGADFRISDNAHIFLIFDEVVGLSIENKGNFSKNIVLGYKVDL